MKIFQGKHIVLGVTGSIAAYKSVTLASRLTQAGAQVDVVLTDSAAKLVSSLSFESVTGRKAYQDQDLWEGGEHVLHIKLGEENDVFLIAPATANTIAKLAHGIADNFLTVSALASRTKPLVAPAMDGGMFNNQATQDNLALLREHGIGVLGPAEGHLASGLSGKGRMLEPETLMGYLRLSLAEDGPLAGHRVMVTAGGTQEMIDPVRMLTNRSSGKQGYALAQSILDAGGEVTLVSAPTTLEVPVGVEHVPVTTAGEMEEAVMNYLPDMDAVIMAAAVADFQPSSPETHKIKKIDRNQISLDLTRTGDILASIAEYRSQHDHPEVVVGFAAESENLKENALKKLTAKQVDLMVANDISAPQSGFGVDTNQVLLLWSGGRQEQLPVISKHQVAERVVEEVIRLSG